MRIVELSDYSMIIMKDSEDPYWVSIGDIYREASRYEEKILVDIEQLSSRYLESSDYIYSAGRLVLFFKDRIPDRFHLHDKVVLHIV